MGAPTVLLKGPLHPYTGYGQDGIGLAQALMQAGIDVYLDPSHVSPPLPGPVAALLTKRQQAPFDLLIHHHDPGSLGISPQARAAARLAVAWTMWEYTSTENLKGRSTLRGRLSDYDLVIGYDPVSTAALRPHAGTLGTLQGGFWPAAWPSVTRDWHGARFGFCMLGQLHQRKDPFVAIQAFKELKQEYPTEFDDAELHLKTTVAGLHPAMQDWCPKLRIHYAVWPEDVVRDFYAAQHCMLLPSRGEGKSVPALEFQSTGGAVIATNWGGPTQWLSREYAYPLDYTLVPEAPTTPGCLSARASKDALKALMLHVYRHRDEVAAKAQIAARVIPAMCSWQVVLRRLSDLLAEHTKDPVAQRLRQHAYHHAQPDPLGA